MSAFAIWSWGCHERESPGRLLQDRGAAGFGALAEVDDDLPGGNVRHQHVDLRYPVHPGAKALPDVGEEIDEEGVEIAVRDQDLVDQLTEMRSGNGRFRS
jgi:hypothetical protein